jgi:hypothetical protein
MLCEYSEQLQLGGSLFDELKIKNTIHRQQRTGKTVLRQNEIGRCREGSRDGMGGLGLVGSGGPGEREHNGLDPLASPVYGCNVRLQASSSSLQCVW